MSTPAPPPRIYPPGGLQFTVNMTQSGQECAVVLGGLGDVSEVTLSVGNAWLAAFWGNLRPAIHNSVTCTGGILRDASEADGASVLVGPPAANLGGASGTNTVAAASYLLRWNTGQGGRSRRGRTFLPGVPASAMEGDGRTLLGSAQTTVNTAILAYLDSFSTGALQPIEPGILSFRRGYVTGVVSGSVAPVVGIQRRRMRG